MITSDKLRPWQLRPANHLLETLKNNDSALDGSDCGAGKTYIAVAIAAALDLPTLVVVPKISVSAWKTVFEQLNNSSSLINYEQLRTGKSVYGCWTNQESIDSGRRFALVCTICQRRTLEGDSILPCPANSEGIHCFEREARPIVYGKFRFNEAVKFVIFDEAHRCGGIDSLNAEILIAAKRQRIKHLMLSATPAQNIMQLRAIGYSLDLHCLDIEGLIRSNKRGAKQKVFSGWLASLGARKDPQAHHQLVWRVSEAQQRETMNAIRSQIFPARGIRITTDQIPNFPKVDIQAQLIDTDHENEISEAYKEMSAAIAELHTTALSDADPEHPLTKMLRARQKIALLKIPAMVELARDRLDSGYSIGLFCNFRQSLEELSRRLQCPIIDGTVTGAKRDEIIASYQNNDCRCLALNSEAAGICISLQDLDGNHPRFGLVDPPWSATTFKQLIGRFPRDGGKSTSHFRVLFAAGTVEMKMYSALRSKLNNLAALTDGDLRPENLKLCK